VIFSIALALRTPRPSEEEEMPTKSRIRLLRRRSLCLAGVIVASAIAAPVAEASADPTPAAPLSAFGGWPDTASLGAYGAGLGDYGVAPYDGFIGPVVPFAAAVAIDPPVINSVFNGGTTVAIATGPAVANTIASP
jgi:hypothetical protein